MQARFYSGGFTLVEVFITLAIFVAVIVAVTTFEINIFSNQKTVSSSLESAQDAQLILKTMLFELRSATSGSNGAYAIVNAGTSTLTFFSNPNGAALAQEITYTLASSTIYRAVIPPSGTPVVYNPASQSTTTLLTQVYNSTSTPVFQYFDQNYTGTSSPLTSPISLPSVRLIKISLTLDDNLNSASAARTYTTQVSLRNLKTNL